MRPMQAGALCTQLHLCHHFSPVRVPSACRISCWASCNLQCKPSACVCGVHARSEPSPSGHAASHPNKEVALAGRRFDSAAAVKRYLNSELLPSLQPGDAVQGR